MLLPRERLLGAVAGLVLASALTTVAYDEPLRPQPTAAVVPAAVPTPSAEPAPAPPLPGPPATRVPAALVPAAPEPPRTGCPPPGRTGGPFVPRPRRPPAVAEAALPAPRPVAGKARDLGVVQGKGLWVTNFATSTVDVPALVARAKASGLTSLWVRTGGSRQGYYGQRVLPQLVPAARAAGLGVIAWDFPFLSDPVADAVRARQAFADGVDAFAPDVETAAEGTYPTRRRVELYLSLVRAYAGDRVVAATVPRPTPTRLASFPYASFRGYADVFVPMVYWSCKEPGALVQESLAQLGRYLPVHPVGQAYDMGPEGGRAGTPSRAETWRFLDVARRGGAVGASLWTVEHAGAGQLQALSDYPWSRVPG